MKIKIEIPEAITLSRLIIESLKGKVIETAEVNHTPHKFAWFCGNLSEYD